MYSNNNYYVSKEKMFSHTVEMDNKCILHFTFFKDAQEVIRHQEAEERATATSDATVAPATGLN